MGKGKMKSPEAVMLRQKASEEKLRESEELFRTLADTTSTAIFVYQGTKFVYSNKAVLKISGYSEEEFLSQNFWDFVHPDFRDLIKERGLARQRGEEIINNYEFKVICKDGTEKWLDFTASSINWKGNTSAIGTAIDITERKLAEEALRMSESRLSSVIEGTNVGTWEWNVQTGETVFNERWAEIVGYTLAELAPVSVQTWLDLAHPEDLKESEKQLAQVFTRAQSHYDIECRMKHRNGDWVWVHDRGKVIEWTADGKPFHMAGTHTEITKRKRAEETLRENEARLTLALQISHSGCFDWNLNTNESVWSDELKLLHGLRTDESFDNLEHFLSCLIPEDRPYVISEMQRVIQQGESALNRYRICRRDNGEVRWVEARCQLFYDTANRPAKIIGVVADITENKQAEELLKASEEKFRQLIENSFDMIVLLDSNGIQHFVSESCEKILGYRQEELINIPVIQQMIHPDDQEKVMSEFQIAIKKGYGGIQYRHRHKNGGWVYLEAFGTNQLNNPYINSLVLNVRDITERKNAEEALAESEARLRELNATKDKFFSIIAHDLRSPFHSIIGFSNLLVRQIQKKDNVGIEKYAWIIQNSAERTMDLLMNLLEWSRSQTGRMEFSPEYIEIVELINKVTKLLSDSAQQKSITISRELPHNAPVFADKAMIGTILRNLISNAVKFTNPGGKIVISAEQKQDELMVSVCDSGVGIKKHAIGKLFRIDKSYSTIGTQNEKGTGLGLLLCKEFVIKHGGKIWIESELGRGSEFHFTIPKATGQFNLY
jgi:two-component system sensor histidine kinase/response regulator